MPDSSLEARIVLTTVASLEEATSMANKLVEERLVACATIIPAVSSVYRWEGRVTSAPEILLVLKTTVALVQALDTRLHSLHTYDTPEFLVLPVEATTKGYLNWLAESLRVPS
ncbi:MAG TPA: divalent-cation tolerance protein CutA [Terracidiphilus sp.]|nr:divalent-cation tolerance protein CutA [Terracidiphilus sp.]